jgi:hypothetical protein
MMVDFMWHPWCRDFLVLTCARTGRTPVLPYLNSTHVHRWVNQSKDNTTRVNIMRDPIRDRERPRGQRAMKVWANWNGGYTPHHLGLGKGRILKGEILEDINHLPVSQPPSCWRRSCLTFTFYFHNKSLLNYLTIFLSPIS